MQTVREFTDAFPVRFVETTAQPRQPQPATSEELRRAFDDLLLAMAPAERAAVTRTVWPNGRPQPNRQLDTSPAAIAKARALFGI